MFEYGELKFSSCIMSDIKTAATVYPVHDLIKKRWSPRAFSEEPVSRTQVFQLLEAARWAASSYNDQPWRFVVGIKGEASYDKILQTKPWESSIRCGQIRLLCFCWPAP